MVSEEEVELLRTERAMLRAMCRVKPIGRKNTNELMQMLGITVPIERMIRAETVSWYRHVLRKEEGNILKEVLNFEITGRRKRRRPKATWKKQVEALIKHIDLRKKDSSYSRKKWRPGV